MHITRLRMVLVVCGLVALSGRPCGADVMELYRSPLAQVSSIAVNPADGSWWAGDKAGVVHFSPGGAVLSRTYGFRGTAGLSVDPSDGSCWAVDCRNQLIVHLAQDGTVLWSSEGINRPLGTAVDASDGSCWVTTASEVMLLAKDGVEQWRRNYEYVYGRPAADSARGAAWVNAEGTLVHLSRSGAELWRGGVLSTDTELCVDPADGSCWVAPVYYDYDHLARFSFLGEQIVSVTGPERIRLLGVNPSDESLWVSDGDAQQIIQFSQDGVELGRITDLPLYCPPDYPVRGVLDPTNGSFIITNSLDGGDVVRLSSAGEEVWRLRSFVYISSVSVNPSDGTCWVSDGGHFGPQGQWTVGASVVKVAENGMELLRSAAVSGPEALAVNPADGSCWVGDVTRDEVIHLSAGGAELWRGGSFAGLESLSVNPADGSCWVGDSGRYDETTGEHVDAAVVHLAADGSELWRTGALTGFIEVAVNPSDGTCWVVISDAPASAESDQTVVHLAPDGSELWRGSYLTGFGTIAVNPSDGSVWLAGSDAVVHVAADGTLLWHSGTLPDPISIAVDPRDGSCWVSGAPGVLCERTGEPGTFHFAADGTELWHGSVAVCCPTAMSVNTADGTLWLWDPGGGLVHLKFSRFADVPFSHWAYDEIDACAVGGIVRGYPDGTYGPDIVVSRDQMAVYIARALAGGDAAVPTGPAQTSFHDVPTNYWAYRYIEYAHANDIVEGYAGGVYRPSLDLDRAQMAVFIARAIVTPYGDEGLVGYSPPDTPTFPDVSSRHWAYNYIEYIAQDSVAVAHGYPDGLYHPDWSCTRDQMAAYVARAFKLPV